MRNIKIGDKVKVQMLANLRNGGKMEWVKGYIDRIENVSVNIKTENGYDVSCLIQSNVIMFCGGE